MRAKIILWMCSFQVYFFDFSSLMSTQYVSPQYIYLENCQKELKLHVKTRDRVYNNITLHTTFNTHVYVLIFFHMFNVKFFHISFNKTVR